MRRVVPLGARDIFLQESGTFVEIARYWLSRKSRQTLLARLYRFPRTSVSFIAQPGFVTRMDEQPGVSGGCVGPVLG
jgi:hypothetical protein